MRGRAGGGRSLSFAPRSLPASLEDRGVSVPFRRLAQRGAGGGGAGTTTVAGIGRTAAAEGAGGERRRALWRAGVAR